MVSLGDAVFVDGLFGVVAGLAGGLVVGDGGLGGVVGAILEPPGDDGALAGGGGVVGGLGVDVVDASVFAQGVAAVGGSRFAVLGLAACERGGVLLCVTILLGSEGFFLMRGVVG